MNTVKYTRYEVTLKSGEKIEVVDILNQSFEEVVESLLLLHSEKLENIKNISVTYDDDEPEFMKAKHPLMELPIGTRFYVTNGCWEGQIIRGHDGTKYVLIDNVNQKIELTPGFCEGIQFKVLEKPEIEVL